MEEKKINEDERSRNERGTEEWRETDERGGQADGWKPHPGLLPLCQLSSVISRQGGSQVLFQQDMGGRMIVSIF